MRTLLFVVILLPFLLQSQDKATVSGYVKDVANGEMLIGATVYKSTSAIAATTNEYGFYSLTLPKGKHVIAISMIGYKTVTFELDLQSSLSRIFELEDESRELEEVTVLGEAADR